MDVYRIVSHHFTVIFFFKTSRIYVVEFEKVNKFMMTKTTTTTTTSDTVDR